MDGQPPKMPSPGLAFLLTQTLLPTPPTPTPKTSLVSLLRHRIAQFGLHPAVWEVFAGTSAGWWAGLPAKSTAPLETHDACGSGHLRSLLVSGQMVLDRTEWAATECLLYWDHWSLDVWAGVCSPKLLVAGMLHLSASEC